MTHYKICSNYITVMDIFNQGNKVMYGDEIFSY